MILTMTRTDAPSDYTRPVYQVIVFGFCVNQAIFGFMLTKLFDLGK